MDDHIRIIDIDPQQDVGLQIELAIAAELESFKYSKYNVAFLKPVSVYNPSDKYRSVARTVAKITNKQGIIESIVVTVWVVEAKFLDKRRE